MVHPGVEENLRRVRERIAAAARRAGRNPADVRLITVTKGVPADRIREAIACGVREVGENRVQEARQKQALLGTVPSGDSPQPQWHLIGHLQRNKAKLAVELFDCIHSIDSPELIEALDRQAAARRSVLRQAQDERELEVLIQVNVSGEATQHGCQPEEAAGLAEAIFKTKHLKWTGLMTMAPFSQNPEDSRPFFRQLRQIRDDLEGRLFHSRPKTHDSSLHLSMGMSQDFEVAVEEGATMVRVGTAIFQ